MGRKRSPKEQIEFEDLFFWNNVLGAYLRDERLAQQLSLRDLERQTGVSDSEIHKVETGDQECRLSSFVKICAALGIPPGLVLDEVVSSSFAFFEERARDDPTFKEFCAKVGAGREEGLAAQIGAFCSIAAQLLRSSNATRKAESLRYPTDSVRKAFYEFAAFVDGTASGLERSNISKMLRRSPVAELRKRGLLDRPFFEDFARRVNALRAERDDRGIFRGEGVEIWWPLAPRQTPFYSSQEASRHGVREAAAKPDLVAELQKRIDEESIKRYWMKMPKRQSTWKDLRRRLRAVTRRYRAQAELARELEVTPQAVAEWLAGASAPTADKTLRILSWVGDEERKQTKKNAGVSEAPAQKTRRKSNYEKDKPTDRKRR